MRKESVSDYYYGDPLESIKNGAQIANAITNWCYLNSNSFSDAKCNVSRLSSVHSGSMPMAHRREGGALASEWIIEGV